MPTDDEPRAVFTDLFGPDVGVAVLPGAAALEEKIKEVERKLKLASESVVTRLHDPTGLECGPSDPAPEEGQRIRARCLIGVEYEGNYLPKSTWATGPMVHIGPLYDDALPWSDVYSWRSV